jgi:hypothetical protein
MHSRYDISPSLNNLAAQADCAIILSASLHLIRDGVITLLYKILTQGNSKTNKTFMQIRCGVYRSN